MNRIHGKNSRAGSALLELALGVLVLSLAFTGTFQFGYTFYQYDNLQTAVNNGARYASLLSWDSTTGSMTTAFKTAVQEQVVYGDPTGSTTTPILSGLATSNVTVTANNQTGSLGVPGSITVAITGYTISSIFSSVTCSSKPSVTYPFQGFVTDGQ